jgi:hypothetical protein
MRQIWTDATDYAATMFAELLLPLGTSVDRDDVEDALGDALAGHLEVTGAGTGAYGSNLDLQLCPDVESDELVAVVSSTLAALGVNGGKLRIDGVEGWEDI